MADGKIINEVLLKCDKLAPDVLINGLDGATVGDYWSWAYSNILCNDNRSILAEFVVGKVLDAVSCPRVEWDAYDLLYKDKKIEVKCSAYLQSWPQKKLSTIQFDIAKKLYWDAKTGETAKVPDRPADCYVFCLYPEIDPYQVDILDIGSWEFYVVNKVKIDAELMNQNRIGLARLKKFGPAVNIDKLQKTVDRELDL
jgi:hypothetical protein